MPKSESRARASRKKKTDVTLAPWAEQAAAIEAEFATGPKGLTAKEAAKRKDRHGPNQLPSASQRSEIVRFLLQFHNVLIYVLLVAAVLALAVGHTVDAAVIIAVVLVNAAVGYIQEGRAERALDAIRTMIDPQASVIRDGRRLTLAAEDIVPGDLVLLEPGDRVPADLRLLRVRNLRIDEAALTGESVPVDKGVAAVSRDALLGDRSSMAYLGTFVAAGSGTGTVVATGSATELGRISTLVGSIEPITTPLIREINALARTLTAIILALSVAVFVFAVLMRGYAWPEAFMVMIGVIVAAIPEGLPAVMTITLAIGVQRMAARNAIVRHLPAVETLGSVSVICSDKTGTLTRNEMTVRMVVTSEGAFEVSGVGYRPKGSFEKKGKVIEPAAHATLAETARAAILCNDAELHQDDGNWRVHGDPMEGALVSLGLKAGQDAGSLRKSFPRTDEIPFDTAHKFMATLHHGHEGARAFAYIKGAPERLLAMCARQRTRDGDAPIDKAFWRAETEAIGRQGQRVLALAVKEVGHGKRDLDFHDVTSGATLLGLVGLIDPPREEVLAAIGDCRTAGISVKMITGDHAATAQAVARQLALDEHVRMMTGEAIDALDDEKLKDAARETAVFARTSPAHKLRLVTALQADHQVTAMTGDGVNDAPALKHADIGVAMGRKGTEAAKEAAQLVLADDNFASIVAAVREGRTVYDNLRKVIEWTLPTNGGQAAAIVVAVLLGLTLPVTPVQILWVNMITAVALGLTLAFEPTEPGTMQRPPRPSTESLLSGLLLWRIGFVTLLFVIGAFGMFFYAMQRGYSLELARTLVVNTIVVMQLFYLFSVRYVHGTSLTFQGVVGTPAVLLGIAVVIVAQFALTYLPFMQAIFHTVDVPLADGLLVIGAGVALLLIVELEKRLVWALTSARNGRAVPAFAATP